MIQWSAEILDQLLAPDASKFVEADIPDMSLAFSQSSHWVANYFLNSLTRKYNNQMHAYAHNYLRRTSAAFKSHEQARSKTLAFLAAGGQSPAKYSEAIFHWENYLTQSWLGYAILIKIFKVSAFEKNDGSTEQRLNMLYNQSKHAESCIERGVFPIGSTLTVWLECEGLCSVTTRLTYFETGEILSGLARYADILQNPETAAEQMRLLS